MIIPRVLRSKGEGRLWLAWRISASGNCLSFKCSAWIAPRPVSDVITELRPAFLVEDYQTTQPLSTSSHTGGDLWDCIHTADYQAECMEQVQKCGNGSPEQDGIDAPAIRSFDLKPRMKKGGSHFTMGSQRMTAGIFLVKVEGWKWFIGLCDTPSQLWIH